MEEEEAGPAPRRRLLLVEDSEAIRDALSILLEDAGFTVVQAARGEDALRLAAEARPDLVLLDLGLPDMPGLDVARQMRGDVSMAGVPIVAVTGRDEAADREACRVAGCDDYLVKPVNTRELVRRVAELV
jgi:two-component system, cell cycle response regulator DivK